jgi:hypothetical protein
MSSLLRSLRGNPHALNYALLAVLTMGPVMLYANLRSPSSEQIEASLRENYSPDVAKIAEHTERINSFWKSKRNAGEMDAVYSQLLRSGKGGLKRHYELTGTLAEVDAAQDAQAAKLQRLLAQPVTEKEVKDAGVAAALTPQAAAPPPAK